MARPTTKPHTVTLVLLTGLAIMSTNMFLPALPAIADEFGVSYGRAGLIFGGYLAITAFLQILSGPLSDRFGRRPILLIAFATFVVASVLCAIAPTFELFLAARLLQGAVAAGAVLAIVVVRDVYGAAETAARIGYINMAVSLSPMLGPMLGGVLADEFGWRAIFWFYAAAGTGVLALIWADLGETNQTPQSGILRQFRQYPALMRSRRFWGYSLCATFSVGAFFVYVSSAPLVATAALGLSQSQLGVLIGTITVGFFVGNFFTGRFARGRLLSTMMIAGRLSGLFGVAIGFAIVAAGGLSPLTLGVAVFFVGMGNGLTMPATGTGVMSVRPRLAGSAAGFNGAMAVSGGAALSLLGSNIVVGPASMFGLMLACVLAGLLAALYVRHIDLAEAAIDHP